MLPPPSGPSPEGSRASGLAVAALVLGILGILFVVPLVGCILALIFGCVARSSINKSDGSLTGSGMATAGIVLGIIGLVLVVVFAAVAIPLGVIYVKPALNARSTMLNGAEAARIYYLENGDSYLGMDAQALREIAPEIEFSDAPGDWQLAIEGPPEVVYVDRATAETARLYCYSSRGDRFVGSAAGDLWRFSFTIDGEWGRWSEDWGPEEWENDDWEYDWNN